MAKNGIDFKYPSYVQDILGPLCFDYGFGPFRWVCTSGKASDLAKTDAIALSVMKALQKDAPQEIAQQLQDNCDWIAAADDNQLVVGSQARILYADTQGRIAIAAAFNKAIASGEITAAIVLGRDHHDVSGTDSPYRETLIFMMAVNSLQTWPFTMSLETALEGQAGCLFTTVAAVGGERL